MGRHIPTVNDKSPYLNKFAYFRIEIVKQYSQCGESDHRIDIRPLGYFRGNFQGLYLFSGKSCNLSVKGNHYLLVGKAAVRKGIGFSETAGYNVAGTVFKRLYLRFIFGKGDYRTVIR